MELVREMAKEPRDQIGRDAAAIASVTTVKAEDGDAGLRLDRFLTGRLVPMTRSRIQELIRDGFVSGVAGTIGDPSRRVKPGDVYSVGIGAPVAAGPRGEAMPLAVVFEDEHLVVVDKPAGLVVHPAAGHAAGTLVNALIAHCGDSLSGIGGVRRPGIVHRLDKDTSGLLVVAKTDAAHQGLAEQFKAHGADGNLERAYLALVWGVPSRTSGEVRARLARSRRNRTKIAVVTGESGRHAVTHFEVEERYATPAGKPCAALVRLQLETGRTHQIRVHMAHMSHPVMGDPVYAAGYKASANTLSDEQRRALADLGRQALHAATLAFVHPVTGRRLRFESPLPPDMARLRQALSAGRCATSPRSRG